MSELRLDGEELLPAPAVSPLEINCGTEEVPGRKYVSFDSDCIFGRRTRAQLLSEKSAESHVGALGDNSCSGQFCGQLRVGGEARNCGAEVPGDVRATGESRTLLSAFVDLPDSCDLASVGRVEQALRITGQRRGNGSHSSRERPQLCRCAGRHQVEDHAHHLDR